MKSSEILIGPRLVTTERLQPFNNKLQSEECPYIMALRDL